MKTELFYFDDCPSYEHAAANLKEALRLEGLPETVEMVRVASEEDARQMRFIGSPTIRIDGVDLEGPEAETQGYGYGCRVYSSDNGFAGWPSVEQIRSNAAQADDRTEFARCRERSARRSAALVLRLAQAATSETRNERRKPVSCCCSKPTEPQTQERPRECPRCGRKGRPVERITLEHLLREPNQNLRSGEQFLFCATPSCEVTYFSITGGTVFEKQDVNVRIGIKEQEDPIPVCYCFGHTRASVWREIEQTGDSTVVASIKEAVQDGRCECETRNPSGKCCLGEVTRAVQAGFERLAALQPAGD